MRVCKNCGKEYSGQNRMFCSQKCRAEYLKNYRACAVCGKMFWAPPSSRVVTCGQACESINRSKNKSNLENLEMAWEASIQSPNSGAFDTNASAKSWGLLSPNGDLYEVNNLSKWCREHTDIIPYADPKIFAGDLYKIKAGKIMSAGGWTLAWWSEENKARKGMENPKPRKKHTKMTEEERLERKRQRSKAAYYRKKKQSEN